MAAKTPVAVGTNGFVRPEREAYGGIITSTQGLLANGSKINLDLYSRQSFYFADIDNTDTWASGISGIVAIYVKSDDVDGTVAPAVFWDAAGACTFASSGNNWAGELLVFSQDPSYARGKRSL